LVQVWPRAFVAEDILIVVGAEGTAVLPLGIGDTGASPNGEPAPLAHRLAGFFKSLAEPWDHLVGFGFGGAHGDIIVRQGDIEGVLTRNEILREHIAAHGGIRIVVSAEIFVPVFVPRTLAVRHRIIARRLFAHPENGRDDVEFPRVAAGGNSGLGGDDRRLDFLDRSFAQGHGELFKIRRARGRSEHGLQRRQN